MNVELLALDYHGTISDRKSKGLWTVRPEVIEALIKARKRGLKIAIITSGTGKTVPQKVKNLAHILAFENGSVFHYGGKVYVDKPNGWDSIRHILLNSKLKPKAVGKVVIIYGAKVRGELEEILHTHGLFDYVRIVKNINRLIVAPKGYGKDRALKTVRKLLNVKGAIVAIGDGENDYYLLREADIGIAPANAVDEVKEVANYICDKPDGLCVKEVIEKILEGKLLS